METAPFQRVSGPCVLELERVDLRCDSVIISRHDLCAAGASCSKPGFRMAASARTLRLHGEAGVLSDQRHKPSEDVLTCHPSTPCGDPLVINLTHELDSAHAWTETQHRHVGRMRIGKGYDHFAFTFSLSTDQILHETVRAPAPDCLGDTESRQRDRLNHRPKPVLITAAR